MILEIIERTGFIPNNSARNLKRTDAKCIAVLVKGITNPLFSSMIKIIEEETQRSRYALVLRHVEEQEDEIDVALELERRNGCGESYFWAVCLNTQRKSWRS